MSLLEHVDVIVGLLALTGGLLGAIAVGGMHVGRITSALEHLTSTLRAGFQQNHEEHLTIEKHLQAHSSKLDEHSVKIAKIESTCIARNHFRHDKS